MTFEIEINTKNCIWIGVNVENGRIFQGEFVYRIPSVLSLKDHVKRGSCREKTGGTVVKDLRNIIQEIFI